MLRGLSLRVWVDLLDPLLVFELFPRGNLVASSDVYGLNGKSCTGWYLSKSSIGAAMLR